MATPKRGEIWTADLGQSREWPVVILQSEAAEVVGTTIVIPLTENMGKVGLTTSVSLAEGEGGLEAAHVALGPQLRTLSTRRLRLNLGMLPREKISAIEQRVACLLGLPS